MSKLSNILNGWSNYIKISNPETLKVARQRAEICVNCPLATYGLHTAILPDYTVSEIQGMYCNKELGGCGCPLSTAVRSKDYKCPKNKW